MCVGDVDVGGVDVGGWGLLDGDVRPRTVGVCIHILAVNWRRSVPGLGWDGFVGGLGGGSFAVEFGEAGTHFHYSLDAYLCRGAFSAQWEPDSEELEPVSSTPIHKKYHIYA